MPRASLSTSVFNYLQEPGILVRGAVHEEEARDALRNALG